MSEIEVTSPPKTITIKSWSITMKSGKTAEFTIREDLGDSQLNDVAGWLTFRWPRFKRNAVILNSEIAAVLYEEIIQKVVPKYVPANAKKDKSIPLAGI